MVGDAEYDAFLAELFTRENNIPSTGMGMFDAAYSARTGVLDITLRVGFNFKGPVNAGVLSGNTGNWTVEEKRDWVNEFVDVVQRTWNVGHIIRCVRPGWCVEAMPVLHVVPTGQDPHYIIAVHRDPPFDLRNPRPNFRPSVSDNGLIGTHRHATYEEDNLEFGSGSKVVAHAQEVLEGATATHPFRFDVDGDSATFAPGEEQRVLELGRQLSELPSTSPVFEVWAKGWDSQGAAVHSATDQVAQHLDGAPHDVVSVGRGDNAKGDVTLRINQHPAYIRYDSKYTHAGH